MLLSVVDKLERQLTTDYVQAAAEEMAERLVTPPFDFQLIADKGIEPFGMGGDRWYGPEGCGCKIDVSLPHEAVLHHPIGREHPEALPGTGTSWNPIPQPETSP